MKDTGITLLRKTLLLFALVVPASIAVSADASTGPRHYDCSKPGNANKAACKGPISAQPAAARPTPAGKEATSVTTKTTTRRYDCTNSKRQDRRSSKGDHQDDGNGH